MYRNVSDLYPKSVFSRGATFKNMGTWIDGAEAGIKLKPEFPLLQADFDYKHHCWAYPAINEKIAVWAGNAVYFRSSQENRALTRQAPRISPAKHRLWLPGWLARPPGQDVHCLPYSRYVDSGRS